MKIISLLENTSLRNDVGVEHGLSLYIETKAHKLLFDMGQTDLFEKNALILGVDLSEIDIAVLSHGHYDHGGGLKRFLEINSRAPVYIHRDAFLPHYNGCEKYIGLDLSVRENERLIFTEDEWRIDDSLALYSCNGRERVHPPVIHGLTEKTNAGFVTDDFRHEQYLLIEEDGKRVLISGCSHKGILDIADWFEPDVLIGGFHYSKLSLDESLADRARTLSAHPAVFYTCHCTGKEQYGYMKQYMETLNYLSCGETISI